MQRNLRRFFTIVLALLPIAASAHPGHSAFDPTVAPHPGHAGEYLSVICGAVGVLVVAARAYFKNQR
jgi:hypothetical protein